MANDLFFFKFQERKIRFCVLGLEFEVEYKQFMRMKILKRAHAIRMCEQDGSQFKIY